MRAGGHRPPGARRRYRVQLARIFGGVIEHVAHCSPTAAPPSRRPRRPRRLRLQVDGAAADSSFRRASRAQPLRARRLVVVAAGAAVVGDDHQRRPTTKVFARFLAIARSLRSGSRQARRRRGCRACAAGAARARTRGRGSTSRRTNSTSARRCCSREAACWRHIVVICVLIGGGAAHGPRRSVGSFTCSGVTRARVAARLAHTASGRTRTARSPRPARRACGATSMARRVASRSRLGGGDRRLDRRAAADLEADEARRRPSVDRRQVDAGLEEVVAAAADAERRRAAARREEVTAACNASSAQLRARRRGSRSSPSPPRGSDAETPTCARARRARRAEAAGRASSRRRSSWRAAAGRSGTYAASGWTTTRRRPSRRPPRTRHCFSTRPISASFWRKVGRCGGGGDALALPAAAAGEFVSAEGATQSSQITACRLMKAPFAASRGPGCCSPAPSGSRPAGGWRRRRRPATLGGGGSRRPRPRRWRCSSATAREGGGEGGGPRGAIRCRRPNRVAARLPPAASFPQGVAWRRVARAPCARRRFCGEVSSDSSRRRPS